MKTRAEAIAFLRQQPDGVRPGLVYEVEPFRPGDAEGVSFSVYQVKDGKYVLVK